MATGNSLIMSYILSQNRNAKSPVVGRWFASAKRPATLSTRGLADHIVSHGLIANKGKVSEILNALSECIPELVAQGYGVKLDGLGIFYPTIKNSKGGAESADDFSVQANIEGVRLRFKPDSTDLDDLTSKAFGKRVRFGEGYQKMLNGTLRPLRTEVQDSGDDGE